MVAGNQAIASLVDQLAPHNGWRKRQEAVHALAAALSKSRVWSTSQLDSLRPAAEGLVRLAEDANGDALTLQLVLSAICNLPQAMDTAAADGLGDIIVQALLASIAQSDHRSEQLSYALAAAFNRSTEPQCASRLIATGCAELLKEVINEGMLEAADAKHAKGILKNVQRLSKKLKTLSAESGNASQSVARATAATAAAPAAPASRDLGSSIGVQEQKATDSTGSQQVAAATNNGAEVMVRTSTSPADSPHLLVTTVVDPPSPGGSPCSVATVLPVAGDSSLWKRRRRDPLVEAAHESLHADSNRGLRCEPSSLSVAVLTESIAQPDGTAPVSPTAAKAQLMLAAGVQYGAPWVRLNGRPPRRLPPLSAPSAHLSPDPNRFPALRA